MKFRFPIVIIDEDFRSENTSGLGIRALAQAIETEGFEVLGVTSYGDLSQFAQQQSRASAFILSIDDEEFTPGPDLDPAVLNLRHFIAEVRRKNLDVPIYVYGETKTSRHIPNDILRELHGRVVPGRVPVLERPPPCTVSDTRGLVNAPLSDSSCSVLHTHGGPRAILGPFARLAYVHQSTIACDRHLACEVRAGALMSLGDRP